jgi:predicted phage baseplate assembly protein
VFQVTYRLGNGTLGNVTAGTVTRCALALVQSVTNPLPATGGVDPETPAQVRQLAPDAFRAVTFRAVRPEDYAEAVERLPWVQRAGASFRWTGSWLTAFATPDPKGSFTVTAPERIEAQQQLDRFRQAGRPAYLLDPVYATLDLQIAICVATSAYRGEVEERVLEALFGVKGIRPRPGFFSPDNFTFGTPLERSQLEAAIQDVEGVKAVERILIRRRGWFDWRVFWELAYVVAPNEVIRVENNPLLPERGAVKLDMKGGA